LIPSSHASSAASFPPTRPQNHDLHEGPKPKMNLQGCEASDAKTLQSQNSQNTKIRILLSALRVVHGRLGSDASHLITSMKCHLGTAVFELPARTAWTRVVPSDLGCIASKGFGRSEPPGLRFSIFSEVTVNRWHSDHHSCD
jgi:hypothetical protein